MVGTILNAIGIIVGGIFGLAVKQPLSAANQAFFKVVLGVATVVVGLRLTWFSVNGGLFQVLKQVGIVIVAMMLGKLIGRLLRLQNFSNSLGQYASERIAKARPETKPPPGEGLAVCALLFCVGPLAVLGAVQDGLSGYYYTLAIKAALDGLVVMALAPMFGWGTMLSALPVFAFQAAITIGARALMPFLQEQGLLDSVNATGGLLVFSVALIILQLKKIEVANYLPSLAIAPLLAWWWGW